MTDKIEKGSNLCRAVQWRGNNDYVDGEVVQHIEYVPFGEVFIEERNNIRNTHIFSMRRNYSYRKRAKNNKSQNKMNNVWYIYCGVCTSY